MKQFLRQRSLFRSRSFFGQRMSQKEEKKTQEPVRQSSPTRRTKCIQFDDNNVVYDVESRSEMTEQDCKRKWFSEKDFECIRARNRRDVKNYLLRKTHKHVPEKEDVEINIRGLERFVKRALKSKKSKRSSGRDSTAIDAVLLEQTHQKLSFQDDPDQIRDTYREYTSKYACEAHQRGLWDEEALRDDWSDKSSSFSSTFSGFTDTSSESDNFCH